MSQILHQCSNSKVEDYVAVSQVNIKLSRIENVCIKILISDACLQYWGGMGFTNDVLISRYYRDLRLNSIGGGADEVMLGIICKFMGTLPKPGK